MKVIKSAALVGILATGSVFAQTKPGITSPSVSASIESSSGAASQGGASMSPAVQADAPKTRTQVYAELVQAERDGQLARLNSTVYRNP